MGQNAEGRWHQAGIAGAPDGRDLATGSPDDFFALIKRDLAKWKRVVKETRMTAE